MTTTLDTAIDKVLRKRNKKLVKVIKTFASYANLAQSWDIEEEGDFDDLVNSVADILYKREKDK